MNGPILLAENEVDVAVLLIVGLSSAALMLLAHWVAGGRHPAWFIRTAIALTALAALLPIRAHEPAALFLIVMPLVATGTWMFYRHSTTRSDTLAPTEGRMKWLRFTLRDLFCGMTFLAIALAIFAFLWREQAFAKWQGLLLTTAALTGIGMFSGGVVVSRKRRWLQAVGLVFCVAALSVWLKRNWYYPLGLGSIVWNYNFDENFSRTLDPIYHCVFVAVLCPLAIILPLALIRFASQRDEFDSARHNERIVARRALVALAVILSVPAVIVYCGMLRAPGLPEPDFQPGNSLPRVLALANEAQANSKPDVAFVEAEGAGDSIDAERLAQIYAEMRQALREPGHSELDPVRGNAREYLRSDEPSRIRGQAQRWKAEARQASSEGRAGRAAQYAVATIQLGNSYSRGGICNHALAGISAEKTGVAALIEVRDNLSANEAREVIEQLERVDQSREPLEVMHQRDEYWYDQAFGWKERVRRAAALLLRVEERNRRLHESRLRIIAGVKVAHVRLLLTELAIRLYREEHGQLPDQLAQLSPKYLSSTPEDPFSVKPLVYRRTGEMFVLYSIGPDEIDDGGKYPLSHELRLAPGFDIDLDFDVRIRRQKEKPLGS